MFIMNDIYHFVDKKLMIGNYHFLENEERKLLVDYAIKEYLASKIARIDSTGLYTFESLMAMNTYDILCLLESLIPEKEHFSTLRHAVHYIINLASNVQVYQVVWYQSDDEKFISQPEVTFDQHGMWDSFTTHSKTKYSDAFKVAYEVLQNEFYLKK